MYLYLPKNSGKMRQCPISQTHNVESADPTIFWVIEKVFAAVVTFVFYFCGRLK